MTVLHALLVGVDRYAPARFPDGLPIRPLLGAVDDARRIERFLTTGALAEKVGRLRTLVSPHETADAAPVDELDLPTRDNLVREIRMLGEHAKAGDDLLVHFSGHGARVRTLLPEVKGAAGWDECLAPSDVGSRGVLRDVEIHALVSDLAARDLRVLVVLDACHSGGAFRSGDPEWAEAGVRTLGSLGSVVPGPNVSAFVRRGLAKRWADAVASTPRHLAGHGGWFPLPRRASLLAACGPHELARERFFEGVGYAGALTRFLLDALATAAPDTPLSELHGRLLARLAGLQPRQTPVLEGERDRSFWPGARSQAPHREPGALVLAVEPGRPARTRLSAGWFHGVRVGARFDAGTGPRSKRGSIVVVEAGATESWAEVETGTGLPEPGTRILLGEAGPLARRWRLAVPEARKESAAGLCLEEVRRSLPRRSPVRVDLAEAGERPDFVIGITAGGDLQVLDGDGADLPRPAAPIPAHHADASDRLLERVEHVARYRQLSALRSLAGVSSLPEALEIEVFRAPAGASTADEATWEPVNGPVRCGEQVHLVLANGTDEDLDMVVLALHSDWSVSRVHPPPGRAPWGSLERRSRTVASFVAYLPTDLPASRDLLLVFGAAGPLDLSCHELPALGARRSAGVVGGGTPPGVRAGAFRSSGVPPGSIPWAVASTDILVSADSGFRPLLRSAGCTGSSPAECRS